jgi:nucleotide-binding universal stress UspA family protein
MTNKSIIVGVDGTDSSNAAIDWAVREAVRRGLPLRLVHVFDWDWSTARYDYAGEYFDQGRSGAEAVVAAADDRARKAASGIAVETDVLIGYRPRGCWKRRATRNSWCSVTAGVAASPACGSAR